MIFLGASALTYGYNYPFLTAQSARAYLGFFVGVCLAILMERKHIHKNKWVLLGCGLFEAFFVFLFLFVRSTVIADMRFILAFLVWPCLVIVFRSPLMERLISQRVWGALGGIAFNTYMWHADMLIVINMLCVIVPGDGYYTRTAMLCFTLGCLCVGALSYYLLDRPITLFLISKIKSGTDGQG